MLLLLILPGHSLTCGYNIFKLIHHTYLLIAFKIDAQGLRLLNIHHLMLKTKNNVTSDLKKTGRMYVHL
jgi:hypothetical protein